MTTQAQSRTQRRAYTKSRTAQKLKIAAYYKNFRGGKNRQAVAFQNRAAQKLVRAVID